MLEIRNSSCAACTAVAIVLADRFLLRLALHMSLKEALQDKASEAGTVTVEEAGCRV